MAGGILGLVGFWWLASGAGWSWPAGLPALSSLREGIREGVPAIARHHPRAYVPFRLPPLPAGLRHWLAPWREAWPGQPGRLSPPAPALVFPAWTAWPAPADPFLAGEAAAAWSLPLAGDGRTSPAPVVVATLTVLTANLWLLPPPAAIDHVGRLDRFAELVLARRPDLVLLQEVWLPSFLVRLRERLPQYHMVTGPFSWYLPMGLVICTRWPVVAAWWSAFDRTRHHNLIELIAAKGCLGARLATPYGRLEVVDTHLYAAGPERERQLLTRPQLAGLVDRVLALPSPVIVAGDLNLTASAVTDVVAGRLVQEADLSMQSVPYRPHHKIDHILVWTGGANSPAPAGSDESSPGRQGWSELATLAPSPLAAPGLRVRIDSRPLFEPWVSDHLPVLATITFALVPASGTTP
jgi:endonuclease/exonuclease/phosphatase family metal-dependent hydrolase